MLKSELAKLQQFMQQWNGRPVEAVQKESWQPAFIYELQQEIDRLQTLWVKLLFGPVPEHTLARYLHYHQAGLLLLLEEFTGKQNQSAIPVAGGPGECTVAQLLAGLLTFLKTRASRYFDADQALSAYERERFTHRARQMLGELRRELRERVTDPAFWEMLTGVLEEAIRAHGLAGTTYRQADNVLHWFTIIQQVLEENTEPTAETLFDSLYRSNFNVPELFSWYEQRLGTKQREATPGSGTLTPEQQVKHLRFITVDTRQAFSTGEPSTSVLAGLLLSDAGTAHEPPGHREKHHQPKAMPLTLSVPQLGLFLRLCYLEGCFADSNISR